MRLPLLETSPPGTFPVTKHDNLSGHPYTQSYSQYPILSALGGRIQALCLSQSRSPKWDCVNPVDGDKLGLRPDMGLDRCSVRHWVPLSWVYFWRMSNVELVHYLLYVRVIPESITHRYSTRKQIS